MSQKSLEQYRIFPYIAWSLVIGFAFFVYNITLELKEAQTDLAIRTATLEAQANMNPIDITNFNDTP